MNKKKMKRGEVERSCSDCASRMTGDEGEFAFASTGAMLHICGKSFSFAELAHANTVRGVEIFAPGKHNGEDYTEQDVDDMISAFGELDYRPALKIGHTKPEKGKSEIGAPAFGWVSNLRKVGGKLVADLESMHDTVVQAIKDGRYDRVSAEIYFNLERGKRTFRRALKAVALLGAEVPAVADLVPLHKIEFANEGAVAHSVEEKLSVPANALIEAMAERVRELTDLISAMKELDMKTLKELRESHAQLSAELEKLKGKTGKDAEAEIATLSAKITALAGDIRAAEAIEAERSKNEALTARIAALEADNRAKEVTALVATCSIPSFRPSIEAVAAYALARPSEKVKVFALPDEKGVRAETEKPLIDVVRDFIGQVNSQGERLFSALAERGIDPRKEGDSANAADEVDKKARELRAKEPAVYKTYGDAMNAVLAADPALAKRYAAAQGGETATAKSH